MKISPVSKAPVATRNRLLPIFENMGYLHPIAPRGGFNRIVKIYFDIQKKREALEKQ